MVQVREDGGLDCTAGFPSLGTPDTWRRTSLGRGGGPVHGRTFGGVPGLRPPTPAAYCQGPQISPADHRPKAESGDHTSTRSAVGRGADPADELNVGGERKKTKKYLILTEK